MAFLDLVNELVGTLPGLSPLLAKKYINRAYAGCLGERTWSFLVTDGYMVCPGAVSTGTASITQYSPTVTLNAAASAAMLPQTVVNSIPGILQLQMRFGAAPQLGGVYSIIAADATNPAAIILTLDRVVVEATTPTSTYQIYRAYVTPPVSDFLKFETVVDIANSITLTKGNITWTSAAFDQRDPQRTSQGLAYYMGGWGGNRTSDPTTGATVPNATVSQGTPIYELWPHPTSGQTFYCRIHRTGTPLVNPTDVQEALISDELIIFRALAYHAYPFAMANMANFPQFKTSAAGWQILIADAKKDYKEELTQCKRHDDAQQLEIVWDRGHGLRSGAWGNIPFPIDAAYIQSHLLNF